MNADDYRRFPRCYECGCHHDPTDKHTCTLLCVLPFAAPAPAPAPPPPCNFCGGFHGPEPCPDQLEYLDWLDTFDIGPPDDELEPPDESAAARNGPDSEWWRL